MAHIVKLKPTKGCQWDQDNKNIYIKINMPGHISIKNVQIFLSDVMLRITSKQKKSSQILDLAYQVDYLSPENRFTLIDGVIDASLRKKTINQKWETLLLQGISIKELKVRRQQSQARYEANIKQIEDNKSKIKTQYDRIATKQLMRFQEEQRKILNQKKEQQKQDALNQVFRNVDERTGKIEKSQNVQQKSSNDQNKISQQNKQLDYQRNKWEEKGKKALQLFEKQEEEERRKLAKENKKILELRSAEIEEEKDEIKQNTMFTDDDINHFDNIRSTIEEGVQVQQIPVRKQAKINLNFSSRPYANIAARDYHYNEPPMPKQHSTLFPPTQGDLQNKNPLWLKDKGDGFMSDKNYQAAINTYNQVLRIDPNQIKVLMNRSLANMKVLNLDAAIHDCDSVLLIMQKQLTGSQDNSQEALLNIIKIKTRKAISLAWKGKLTESRVLLNQQLEFDLSEDIKQQIINCLKGLDNREQSLKIKLKGDQKVKKQHYQEAINVYNQSISIDKNQYAISNKSLCLNKLNRFEESIENAQTGFSSLNDFGVNAFIKNSADVLTLYLKLLYRKAKALEGKNQINQAQSAFRKGLELSPEDKDFKQALKSIKLKQTNQQVAALKLEASELIKQNRSKQALDIYTKCLKMLESAENTSEYLSILQNQCVCYLKLQQYDSVVSISNRILKLVNNLSNRIVDFDRKKGNLTKEQLNKVAIRTLVRRANAYLKTGRRQNAKGDLQKALQIDPNDQSVAKQLSRLKQAPAF